MDSSPDLSLKLRRGSSDSRDSFYMDFAQGIDSDIEEVDTTVHSAAGAQGQTDTMEEEADETTAAAEHQQGDDDDSPTIPLPPPPHIPSENG